MKHGMFVAAMVATLMAVNPVFAKSIIQSSDRIPGEILVKYKSEVLTNLKSKDSLDNVIYTLNRGLVTTIEQTLGRDQVSEVKSFQTDKEMQTVILASDQNFEQALQAIQNNPAVKYAEPNYRMYALAEGDPNDEHFAKLWGMKNTGQADSAGQVGTAGADIDILPVWQKGVTGNRKIVVAVIDTGIDWTHPDLKDNLYTNKAEIVTGRNGKDDDNNGFIDDIHGWNFVGKNNNSNDDNNHGTHCAGTIGGMGNNKTGVVGVNWAVSLMPVKFLSAQGGGSLQGAIESINYARMMKVNVMSNSWGGGGFTQGLMDAITATKDAGIVFVAAAGNSKGNNDTTPSYPASYKVDNVISVAATDNKDALASFSCYGATTVHVAAPGVNVMSSVKGGGYASYSGTSMATPHVAGLAALMLSVAPQMRAADIKTRLIQSSDPIAGLKGKVVSNGRVNAKVAIMGRAAGQR